MKGFVFMKGFNGKGVFKEPLRLFVSCVSRPRSRVCDEIHVSFITTRVPTCRAV